MAMQTVTLDLPDALYDRLKRRAAQARRSVQEELLDVLVTAVSVADELPSDLTEALSPLALLDDEDLWRAARSRFPAESVAELEALHLKRQREGLTAAEAETAAGLVRQYERAMLVRARAAALLKGRGHDIGELVTGGISWASIPKALDEQARRRCNQFDDGGGAGTHLNVVLSK